MEFNRHERYEKVTLNTTPKRILGNTGQIAVASSIATRVGNLPITSQSLEVTLEEMGAQVPRVEGEDTFDGCADSPVSEECPALKIRSTHFCSSARLRKTVNEEIASIPALVRSAFLRLCDDAGRVTESSPVSKVVVMIRAIVISSIDKAFQNSTFQNVVEIAVQK